MIVQRKILVIFIVILSLSLPVMARGATYYLRADGTAANKAAASGPCGTAANCMNVSVHNGETFSAGDTIKVCDDGGVFYSQLTIPSSGTSGNPITYEAKSGDSPVFSGFTIYTAGWTLHSGNIYKRSFSLASGANIEGERCVVMHDSTVLTWDDGDYASLDANEWDHYDGYLYINIGENPSGENICATTRAYCIYLAGHDYITVTDIDLKGGVRALFGDGSNYFTATDVDIQYHSYFGLRLNSASYSTLTRVYAHTDIGYDPGAGSGVSCNISISHGHDHTVTDCKGYNGRRGLEFGQSTGSSDQSGTVVSGGEYYGNTYDTADADGITIVNDTSTPDQPSVRPVIEKVKAHGNADHGIDLVYGNWWIVRYCKIYDQTGEDDEYGLGAGQGTKGGQQDDNTWLYNQSWENQNDGFFASYGGDEYYGNTSHNNGGYGFHFRYSTGFTAKNNIASDNTDGAVWWRGTNPGTLDYNCWHKGTGNHLLTYGTATHYEDLATYQAASGEDANSIESDPLFNNEESHEYWLTSLSPCIDAGVDLGATWDGALLPGDWPNSGDQDTYTPWEIGAYLFGLAISNASPPNDATGVSITVDPSWTNPTGENTNDGYFKVGACPCEAGDSVWTNQAHKTSYDPGTLAYSTIHCWRVDIDHDGGTETGIDYEFTTTSEQNPPPSSGSVIRYQKHGAKGRYHKKGVKIKR